MLLLDSDMLIDVALDRPPYADASRAVLGQVAEGAEQACIAWHSFSNIDYIVTRELDRAIARAFIEGLLEFAQVAATTTDDLYYALSLPLADFEDAMQVAAARACDARYIVTRNVRDYVDSPVPTLTPADAIAELSR
ncbi:MAG: PIN domain-containing protein [Dehalococcoidia bacterium]|nr:PIN domain-containing protein [Dehalococcoidia bacterium]MYA53990.1 PIN domain-containing protein [Dehalococcoidia bacterium]